MPPRRTAKRQAAQYQFKAKLILYRMILKLLEADSLSQLAEALKREVMEGLDENNLHKFCFELTNRIGDRAKLPKDQLIAYDQNIVRHTNRINEKRVAKGEQEIKWKYFQYLMLLFTEIYLDWYFRDPESLLNALNNEISNWNDDKEDADKLEILDSEDDPKTQLNKIAFWCATGSGKTLIMHANIMQYQHYQSKYCTNSEAGKIILLTPNEGLSHQHIREFETSGIKAVLFEKNAPSWLARQYVEVIDINKLGDESGDKTVAVGAFEGNNLVLVDEGHRGASSGSDGTWMKYRNSLCESGFSFEYSATFGQAVKSNKNLTNTYARSIIFDYSYRYFYEDGFGKHYNILNLDEDTEKAHLQQYLTACLLAFYQQIVLFEDSSAEIREFNLEKPLLIFVGSTVLGNLKNKSDQAAASDVIQFLKFLAVFVGNRNESIQIINQVLNRGLVTADGRDLFAEKFKYLNSLRLSPEQIFSGMLGRLFNAQAGGSVHIEQIKSADGEIALIVGEGNEPFGLINVGDASGLVNKLAEESEFVVMESTFRDSLFHRLSEKHSTINLLIGSKKFMEGWNSWRVSTMGLMNVGRSEGSQVIQLFGRGVRLKGYNWTLKRSNKTETPTRPKHIEILETLNIFGIKADYMAQFKAYLEEEGLNSKDDQVEILLPVLKNLGRKSLKIIKPKEIINGHKGGFKELGPIPTLLPPKPEDEETEFQLSKNKVVINWYPKIQLMRAPGILNGESEVVLEEHAFTKKHIPFIDLDNIFLELERFKAERGWHNLNISRTHIAEILTDRSWYTLYIPGIELEFSDYKKVLLWNELALALLKKYCEHYYLYKKQAWELPHLEYQELTEFDLENQTYVAEDLTSYYRCMVDASETELIDRLTELKEFIEKNKRIPWEYRGLKALWFDRHLFQPLLYMKDKIVEIQPVPLNKGEMQFINDLSLCLDNNPSLLSARELYLLRNLSRGRGVSFFEAGNFYPDFLLWIVNGNQQKVCFIDPKGLSRLHPNDLKIEFFKKIKDIETRLGDPDVTLESFILSTTQYHVLQMNWRMSKDELKAKHVLFQEDGEEYIKELLEIVISSSGDCEECSHATEGL